MNVSRRRWTVLPIALTVLTLALGACTSAATSPAPSTSAAKSTPSHIASAGFDVAVENAKPGSRGWLLKAQAPGNHVLQGYADVVSVLSGQSFGLYVDATAAAIRVNAVRIGWYGGARGRVVWTSEAIPTRRQAAPVANPVTRAYSANWPRTTLVSTTGWPEGDYLLRLDGTDGSHFYVPVTVRSANTTGRVVLSNAVLTWEAYNTWGGRSLYTGEGGGFSSRSYAASFDRPYQHGGLGLFASFEFQVVYTAERLGLPLAYETDVDIATRPGLLAGARGFVSPGHDEYWTVGERYAVEAARDAGTNLAFLGANVSYWRIRLAASTLGANRLEVAYKGSNRDPITGATTTARFRDQPDPHPERLMTGQMYECYPVSGAFVVRDPSFFLFAGTGAHAGSSFPGVIGVEIDRPYPVASTPQPMQVPALSPVTCKGVPTFSGFVYYTAKSGAAVVSVGTMNWTRALYGVSSVYGFDRAGADFVMRVTESILRGVAVPHLGLLHPAQNELFALHLSPNNSTGVG